MHNRASTHVHVWQICCSIGLGDRYTA